MVDYTCVVCTYVWWDTWRYHDDYTLVGGIYEVWGVAWMMIIYIYISCSSFIASDDHCLPCGERVVSWFGNSAAHSATHG